MINCYLKVAVSNAHLLFFKHLKHFCVCVLNDGQYMYDLEKNLKQLVTLKIHVILHLVILNNRNL